MVLFGVKAASSCYAAPGSVASYAVTWTYISGLVLEVGGEFVPSMFLQFSGPRDQLCLVRGSARTHDRSTEPGICDLTDDSPSGGGYQEAV